MFGCSVLYWCQQSNQCSWKYIFFIQSCYQYLKHKNLILIFVQYVLKTKLYFSLLPLPPPERETRFLKTPFQKFPFCLFNCIISVRKYYEPILKRQQDYHITEYLYSMYANNAVLFKKLCYFIYYKIM